MKEDRKSQRINIAMQVEVTHHSVGTQVFEAKDISGTGIFLKTAALPNLEKGAILNAHILELGERARGPDVAMQVVHINEDGIGLKIVKQDDDHLFSCIHRFCQFSESRD